EGIDLVLAVDDLDDDRQILGEALDLGGVQAARMAKAHRAAQHRGAGEMLRPRLEDDRLIERQMLMAVVLADEDAQQRRWAGELHGVTLRGLTHRRQSRATPQEHINDQARAARATHRLLQRGKRSYRTAQNTAKTDS